MRSILTFVLASLIATTTSVQAATAIDALLTTLETANPDCGLIALCDGERIVLLQSRDMAVEVKARATTQHPSVSTVAQSSAAATLVGLLAFAATV